MSNLAVLATAYPEVAKKILKRIEARRHLLNFTLYTKPDYQTNWHHLILCKELEDFVRSKTRNRLIVQVGPRRGKSEIISRRLPAWVFGNFPNMEIMSASYASDLAQAMSRDVQRVMEDDKYIELFPRVRLSGKNVVNSSKYNYVKTADKFEIVNHKGVYKCAGVGGALTGLGGDLIIIDDPVKDMVEATSVKRKQQVYDWYHSVASTRLSANGKVIIVMTRWAEDDLAGRLIADAKKDPETEQWEVISFPELFDSEHEFIHPLDPRKEGEVLWPSRFPQDKMEKRKKSTVSKIWNSLFQQEPAPDSGVILNPNYFQYFKEMPTEFDHKMASWDCTFKETDGSDFVVGQVWGIKGPHKYLLWLVRKRMSFPETIKSMLSVCNRFPDLQYSLIEDKANGPAVISTLKNKVRGLVAYNPNTSKEARAHAVSPQIEAGNVWLPDKYSEEVRRMCPWLDELDIMIEEVKAFPFGKNDDCVDAMTQMLLREGDSLNWLEELLLQKDDMSSKSELDPFTQARNKQVMDMFGWSDTSSENSGTGFSFDLKF
jgi:predicted phage terminase large subunit-like protein